MRYFTNYLKKVILLRNSRDCVTLDTASVVLQGHIYKQ